MQKFWGNLAVQLGKRAGLVSAVGLVITAVLAMGIPQLKFATGQDSYLNKSDPVYQDSVKYQNLFGGQAMVTLFSMKDGHKADEIITAADIAKFAALEKKLKAYPAVVSIVTPVTALQFSDNLIQLDAKGNKVTDPTKSVAGAALLRAATVGDTTAAGRAARLKDSGVTLGRLSAVPMADRVLTNPNWVKFLLYNNDGTTIRKALLSFFPSPTNAQMIIRLKGNESIEDEGRISDVVVKTMKGQTWAATDRSITTGAPVLLKGINDYLRGGMITLGAIAVGIMIIILLLLFDVRWRLLPMVVILVGVTWAFGLAGYLGLPLNLVTIAGLPVMLGVGIDYAIQMHARVEEEVVIDREAHPIQETARNLGPALLVVTFDAVFAFAALHFAKVPMIRQFGLLLAIGIAVICFCSIILPLAVLGIREYKSPTQGRDFREGRLGRLVVFLGSAPSKAGPWLVAASLLIFFGGIITEGKLVLQTDPVQWVNQKSAVIHDLHALEKETGSSSELGIFIQSKDVFSDANTTYLDQLTRSQMKEHPKDLITAASMESTVSFLMEVPGAGIVPPTGAEVRAAYDVAPRDIQISTINDAHTAANLIFRAGPSSLEERAKVVKAIRKDPFAQPPTGVSSTPSGLAVVGVGLLDNLEANRIILTYLAIAFVLGFLAIRLRSIVRSLLSLVPVLIAVGTASLVAYGLHLKLSPMTAVGGPLVVAACTEFTSLILLRFVEERRRGLSPQHAVDVAAARTGRAFIVSGLTAIAGVAVISLSSLPLLRDFGRVVAMNVAVALLSALVVLPPMLVWADKRHWVTRGLIPKDELEATDRANAAAESGIAGPAEPAPAQ